MKASTKSFIFLNLYMTSYFLNVLYQKYIANITFEQFIKWCFTLYFGFAMLLKEWEKEKKEDNTFLRKKTGRINSATMMAYVDGKGTVFTVKLKLEGKSFE